MRVLTQWEFYSRLKMRYKWGYIWGEIKCCSYHLWHRLSLVYIWNIKKLKNNEKFEKKMSNVTKKIMMIKKAIERDENSLKRMKRFILSQNMYHEFHLWSSNDEEDSYIIQWQYTICEVKKASRVHTIFTRISHVPTLIEQLQKTYDVILDQQITNIIVGYSKSTDQPTTYHRPPTTDHRPPTTYHRPPTTDQKYIFRTFVFLIKFKMHITSVRVKIQLNL